MARITVVTTDVLAPLYLDLDRRQADPLRVDGQDRYLHPVNTVAVAAFLTGAGSAITAAALIAGTVGANDVSKATIQTIVADVVLTADQLTAAQNLLSYRIIETGDFKLSFYQGQIKGWIDNGYVKVFVDDGSALYA